MRTQVILDPVEDSKTACDSSKSTLQIRQSAGDPLLLRQSKALESDQAKFCPYDTTSCK